MGNHAQN
jgi:hypothetical protein